MIRLQQAVNDMKFLSTLSLRRATFLFFSLVFGPIYFYPRSPCGERRGSSSKSTRCLRISIHALLAESDAWCMSRKTPVQAAFLSTLSLRRATVIASRVYEGIRFLSTLSLRRATRMPVAPQPSHGYFYPRSPCGERLTILLITVTTLLFLSTLSLRRATTSGATYLIFLAFLSTLSLRRATEQQLWQNINTYISIHALLAESDYY